MVYHGFGKDDWTINPKLSLITGLLGDYHEEYGLRVTPKVSVMYKPNLPLPHELCTWLPQSDHQAALYGPGPPGLVLDVW